MAFSCGTIRKNLTLYLGANFFWLPSMFEWTELFEYVYLIKLVTLSYFLLLCPGCSSSLESTCLSSNQLGVSLQNKLENNLHDLPYLPDNTCHALHRGGVEELVHEEAALLQIILLQSRLSQSNTQSRYLSVLRHSFFPGWDSTSTLVEIWGSVCLRWSNQQATWSPTHPHVNV